MRLARSALIPRQLGEGMRRLGLGELGLLGGVVVVSLGASPAAPSYHAVEQTIGRIRENWARPGTTAEPNAASWNALFDAILSDLNDYPVGGNENDRLTVLNR